MQGTLHKAHFYFTLALGLLGAIQTLAQDTGVIGLTLYIVQLEERFDVKFSYVDENLQGIEIQVPSSVEFTEILKNLTEQTGIEIKKLNERYFTLSKARLVNICGRVFDNFAKNTVPGATIEVLGTKKAIVTNAQGKFSVEDINRSASLQIRYLGYTTKIVAVSDLIEQKGCP